MVALRRVTIVAVFALMAAGAAWGQSLLVNHGIFRARLSKDDYAALTAAQNAERRAADLLLRFYENYDAAADVAEAYAKTSSATEADSLYSAFTAATSAMGDTSRELGGLWESIFDNKSYAYNYILETNGQRQVLQRMESAGLAARDEIAGRRYGEESEAVLRYLVMKGLMFDYERTLAGILEADAALDSLGRAEHVFGLLKRSLPRLELEERSFIDYRPITVHSPSRYNANNPIPEVTIYRNGIVYRVRLGLYPARQAVSIFRGVYPLGYARASEKWAYYAGAYATLAEAEKALADMKKRGFGSAVLALWNDGAMVVLGTGTFRIEVAGGELSDSVRAAINAAGKDLTRAGDRYIIGPFGSGIEAERVAVSIRAADPEANVRTVGV